MAALRLSTSRPPNPLRRRALFFDKVMAAIALLNLGLVAFDYSYIPFRNFYLRQFPDFTWWYGAQFKGIEPHRVTEAYLATVADFQNQVAAEGLTSPQTQEILTELQVRSEAIIDEDPFAVANKSGTLERIKDRIRNRVSDVTGQDFESSKQAFTVFWSQNYLLGQGYTQEIAFFNQQIRPLIETNYFRQIGFDGRPLDEFWRIDLWFIVLFGAEFLARTWYLHRRYRGTRWLDTMLWRWYDLLLLVPFWQWLRVIPVVIRINQSNLMDLEPLRNRIIRGIVASSAVELTEIVVIRLIDQVQNLIRQGEITRWLVRPQTGPRYIDLNDVDEIKVISERLISTLIYQVLPEVRPDIEALLQHNVHTALQKSTVYTQFQRVPGLGDLPNQLTQQVVTEVYRTIYGTLTSSLEDQKGAELTQHLLQHLIATFRSEIQKGHAVEEIEKLMTVWLDEVKINYVRRLAAEDVEKLREETLKIYEIIQAS